MIFLHCVWKPWGFPPLAAFSQQSQTAPAEGRALHWGHWVLITAGIRKTLQCGSVPKQQMWPGKDKYNLPQKVLQLIIMSHTTATESHGQWVNKGNHEKTKEYFSWARTFLAALHTQTHTREDLLQELLKPTLEFPPRTNVCTEWICALPEAFASPPRLGKVQLQRLAEPEHQELPWWLQLLQA